MKNFFRYIPLILALLGLGGETGFANPSPGFGEELPLSSEDLKSASAHLWAYRENPLQDIKDLSENHFFEPASVVPTVYNSEGVNLPGRTKSSFRRDLRRGISQLIFPEHFFL